MHGVDTHVFFFFFNDTATTEIYTLPLHDALPIFPDRRTMPGDGRQQLKVLARYSDGTAEDVTHTAQYEPNDKRSEEHTSELQSRQYLVCRLLLEKKKKNS